MTRPSRESSPPSASSGSMSAIQVFLLASYTACSRFDAVSSGPKTRKLVGLFFMTSRRNSPSGFVFSYIAVPREGTSTAYSRKSGSLSGLRSSPPLACGLALIRRCPVGASARSFRHEPAVCVEQFLGLVAAHPVFEELQVRWIVPHIGEGHLMRSPGPFDFVTLDLFRPGPPLRGTQHNHRPRGRTGAFDARAACCCARISPIARSSVAAIF